jgi:hypothetical protein
VHTRTRGHGRCRWISSDFLFRRSLALCLISHQAVVLQVLTALTETCNPTLIYEGHTVSTEDACRYLQVSFEHVPRMPRTWLQLYGALCQPRHVLEQHMKPCVDAPTMPLRSPVCFPGRAIHAGASASLECIVHLYQTDAHSHKVTGNAALCSSSSPRRPLPSLKSFAVMGGFYQYDPAFQCTPYMLAAQCRSPRSLNIMEVGWCWLELCHSTAPMPPCCRGMRPG